jgi:hypothetical protein
MLIVNLDGVDHRLTFKHGYSDVWVFGKDKTWTTQRIPTDTLARLYPIDAPELTVEGFTELSPEDNPDKAVGKKIALKRLTDKLPKEHSKKIWDAVRKVYPKIQVSAPHVQSRTEWRRGDVDYIISTVYA